MSQQTSHLRVPGPTPLPDAVREAGARQMVNHRGPEFKALLGRLVTRLRSAFRTEHDILILSASGTGGLEAAVVNHLSPGDPVLGVSIGAFGDRFAKIAARYGADVTKLDIEWGRAAEPPAVAESLARMAAEGRPARAVLLTHNETSTGVTNPLGELAAAARDASPETLLLVDGISGLGAVPFETDAWGLDVVVTGSQKSWMVPPGLAMVSVSPRAWSAAEQATMPRFYFDLAAHRDGLAKGETPWTPAVGVAFALDVALDLMEAEGYPAIFARHAACGAATRAGLRALGFRLFADEAVASDTVTAAHLPEDLEWSAFNGAMRERGLVVAGGQGKLTGRIFRVGHLGSATVSEMIAALDIIEAALGSLGRSVEPGASRRAAESAAAAVASGGGRSSRSGAPEAAPVA
ncbi:MAG TPA: alanine--glyoxylate aminotransferase family protein [Candidatus Limnocylindrales bacterium]|nr:alanine--glyoxylate aminotransferase family protein [Candidatus Limnocylindrales bacterium]